MTEPEADLMDKAEAIRRLLTTRRTLYVWMNEGRITPVKIGKSTYVTKESVLRQGAALGMSEDQVMAPDDPGSGEDAELSPFRHRPTSWPTRTRRCRKCDKLAPGGWCLSCGGEYD